MSAPTCPTCGGRFLLDHPCGLVVDHVDPCTVRGAEDARRAADAEGRVRMRPATSAEHVLLSAADSGAPAGETTAVLVRLTEGGQVRRTFRWRGGQWPPAPTPDNEPQEAA